MLPKGPQNLAFVDVDMALGVAGANGVSGLPLGNAVKSQASEALNQPAVDALSCGRWPRAASDCRRRNGGTGAVKQSVLPIHPNLRGLDPKALLLEFARKHRPLGPKVMDGRGKDPRPDESVKMTSAQAHLPGHFRHRNDGFA